MNLTTDNQVWDHEGDRTFKSSVVLQRMPTFPPQMNKDVQCIQKLMRMVLIKITARRKEEGQERYREMVVRGGGCLFIARCT